VLFKIILFFIVVPFVELTLLMQISARVGVIPTLALIVATGILGGGLARWQGIQTIWRLRDQISRGEFPTDTLADGGMILVAAALLLTPGILTDLFGFSLLMPVCRTYYRRWLKNWLQRNVRITTNFQMNQPGTHPLDSDDIIDAEVVSRTRERPHSLDEQP
jgi:UPF0716 protein FxsA